tara:strand:+ start:38 stop:625 length:588 start_codon:yes stop_codon:yes gene_type:complete
MEHTKIYYLHRGDNIPFYVGKTKKHLERFENHKQTFGFNIKMEVISEVKDWRRWEQYYIQKYIDLGYKLENKNKGGGGPLMVSQETKNKISATKQTYFKTNHHSNKGKSTRLKGRKLTEEHKAKIKAKRGHLKGRANTWYSKPVLQYDLDGNFIKEFGSQTEAQYIMGKPSSDGVGACCRGNQKSAYGFKWKYKK